MSKYIKIVPVNGHLEIYIKGHWFGSADTRAEAEQMIREYERENSDK